METIPEEIRRLEVKGRSIRSATADAAPVTGGGSGREDMLLSNIVEREELARRLEQARLWVSSVERSLGCLTESERLVLDRFYIHPARGNVDRLCETLCLEKSAVYDRKDTALRRFITAHYGIVDA